ncbi:hypothetical protein ACQPZJ_23115 [Actinoplanes sp. CA-054009]
MTCSTRYRPAWRYTACVRSSSMAACCPPRAEYLARIELWLHQLLLDQPPARANLVRAWAHWTLLRRARSRARKRPFTADAAYRLRACILAAIRFLTCVDARDRSLDTLTQTDVELWLTDSDSPQPYLAREFLNWARSRGLTGDVRIPWQTGHGNRQLLPEQRRWHHLDHCLTDSTLPDHVRAAGALNLLYGLPLTRISRLQPADLYLTSEHTYLMLGTHRLRLAPAVAHLLRRCTGNEDWIFPGALPGTHTVVGLHGALKRHGMPDASQARAAALVSLAADLPAPVLADLLGIHLNTAVAWARHAATDWTAYLQARAAES